MAFPHTFAAESGDVSASQLDENFNAAALATDLTATNAAVAALPSGNTPLVPVTGGAAGSSPTLSRSDHQHPPQSAKQNPQSGTSYTVTSTDDGKVLNASNGSAITVTFANSIAAETSGLVKQGGAGQITFAAASGATVHQRQSFTKTAGQYAVVSWYCESNAGGTSAVIILSGDMSA